VSSAWINHAPGAAIHAVMISKTPVDAAKVFAKFNKIYVNSARSEFVRFKQRIVRSCCFWPYWTDITQPLDTAYHFRSRPDMITKDGLDEFLGQVQSELLDFDRPVWQLWHFGNFVDENGKACSATMLRMHHAMADGFTALRAMMQGAEPMKPPDTGFTRSPSSRSEQRPKISFFRKFHYVLAAVRKLVLMRNDSVSVFKGSALLGAEDPRVVAWSALKDISVNDLKAAGRSLGDASINDILLTALTAAFQTYAEQSSEAKLPKHITASMWVSLSPLNQIYKDFDELPFRWSNSGLGTVYVKLPVGNKEDPRQLLQSTIAMTRDPALMLEAGVATSILMVMGWMPRTLFRPIWNLIANKVSTSMSNIPGPQFAMEWIGIPLRCILFFVPPVGTVSLFVTIATFNGEVTLGLGGDSRVFRSDALRRISEEFFPAEMQSLVRRNSASS